MSKFDKAMKQAFDYAHDLDLTDRVEFTGYGLAVVTREDGDKVFTPFRNLITDVGDTYYVTRSVAGINSNGISQPTLVAGMKYGTNTATVPAKNGAGANIVGYIGTSARAFFTAYPQVTDLGAGNGKQATYQCQWPISTGTSTNINEIVISTATNDAADASASFVIARSLFQSTVIKNAGDTLTVTWNHLIKG